MPITASQSLKESVVTYTYYDYLELAPGASPARIEAAYSHLLERFGIGDARAGCDLVGLVRMIHAAHDVLSDPAARNAYDRQLAQEAARADAELEKALERRLRAPRRAPDPIMPMLGFPSALAD
jgi:DnaJ-class molecular chaperone